MSKTPIFLAVMAVFMAMSAGVNAEDSEKETPEEEQRSKEAEMDLPQALIDHMAYLEDLDARYPDSAKVDLAKLLEAEGETAALSYCKAIGFDGPCTIDEASGQKEFVAVSRASARGTHSAAWWNWLNAMNAVSVGVIPEPDVGCYRIPYAYRPLVQIHMDDEDRRNANSRWGWLGATTSNRNTTWRFCKIEPFSDFRPLPEPSVRFDYAVLSLGLLCPSGSRRVRRFQDNEDWRNANSSSGNVYPNVGGRNWVTYTCHFDAGKPSSTGYMYAFPGVGVPYGLFGGTELVPQYAHSAGYVHQDDEDFRNINSWNPGATWVTGGGRNTWRKLVKIH